MSLLGPAKRVSRERDTDEQGKKFVLETWLVSADTAELAEADPALPKWDDQLAGSPELRVRRISLRVKDGSWGGLGAVYNAFIEYREPGAIFSTSTQRVASWSGGTMAQRVETDLLGLKIGSRRFVSKDLGATGQGTFPTNGNPNYGAREDPDAQVGADVQVPTIELALSMPSTYKLSIPTSISLLGKVNQFAINLDGDIINSDHMMFTGFSAEKFSALPHQYRVVNYFRIAAIYELPGNVPKYKQGRNLATSAIEFKLYTGGLDYPATAVPIRYGFFPHYVAQNVKFDPASGNPLPKTSLDLRGLQLEDDFPTTDKYVREFIIFEAHPVRDLLPLFE